MATRSRIKNQDNWDPMRDDYDDSTYDQQYPDEETSTGVNLDHCRLYITNIPRNLNEDGFRNVFSKFGTLTETHISQDPKKRYGLVAFQNPGEAKLALMTLNGMEPMRLNISVAHKKKTPDNKGRDQRNGNRSYDRRDRPNGNALRKSDGQRDDASVGSRGTFDRKAMDDDEMDQVSSEVMFEADDLDLEREQLKLEYQMLECKKRILQLRHADKKAVGTQPPSNRCILPGGRVVVTNKRVPQSYGRSGSPVIGAGDSLNIPGLQRLVCLVCSTPTDSCCSGCQVTPYCGPGCQRKDWHDRHRSVCHNLARSHDVNAFSAENSELLKKEPIIPPPAPLRRPRSPNKVDRDDNNQATNERAKRIPPGYNPPVNNRPVVRSMNNNNRFDKSRNDSRVMNNMRNNKTTTNDDDEDWGAKAPEPKSSQTPAPKKEAAKPMTVPKSEPKPKTVPKSEPKPMTVPKSEPKPMTVPKSEPKPMTVPKSEPKPMEAQKQEPKPVEVRKAEPILMKPTPLANDVMPTKKIVPKSCLIETLQVGDVAVLSVEFEYKGGFVCLSMHEKYESEFMLLCDDYTASCQADDDAYTPNPGDSFSYLNPEDSSYYRARRLDNTTAALLDSPKIVEIKPETKMRKLGGVYENVPEFCCLLDAKNVKIGDNLKCILKVKTPRGYRASMENVIDGSNVGLAEITRWVPDVEYAAPVAAGPAPVPRPDLTNDSKVLIVEVTSLKVIFVRPADQRSMQLHDKAVFDSAHYGLSATPLSKPPNKGQIVIAKFTDGCHYRAICKRTNVKQNKYLLEYVDYGNNEISQLENLYECPPELELEVLPTLVSCVSLDSQLTLTEAATKYIDTLKDTNAEVLLTLPSATKAPSGSVVTLTLSKTRENLNKKLIEMCEPDWKKFEEKGGDVVEMQSVMYHDIKYLELPKDGCELEVLGFKVLHTGNISACVANNEQAKYVFTTLTDKMTEYCNSDLGKEPYLPKFEELCIAKCEPYPHWLRAVLCEVEKPGSQFLRLCLLDYGSIDTVDFKDVRKMLPEFAKLPAVASNVEIKGFPKNLTEAQLQRALDHIKVDEETGRGRLVVTKCIKQEEGWYTVEAPALLRAMQS